MKRSLSLFLGLVSCNLPLALAPDFVASWEMLRELGGVRLAPQTGRRLQLECDVSGRSEITTKPRRLNSGLVVRKVSKRIDGQEIVLSIIVGAPKKGADSSSRCSPVALDALPVGTYQVFYKDSQGRYDLGSVVIE